MVAGGRWMDWIARDVIRSYVGGLMNGSIILMSYGGGGRAEDVSLALILAATRAAPHPTMHLRCWSG